MDVSHEPSGHDCLSAAGVLSSGSFHTYLRHRCFSGSVPLVPGPWSELPLPDHRLSGQNHRHTVVGIRPVQACDVCAGFKAKRGNGRGRNTSQRDRKDVVLSLLHNSKVKSGKCFLPILCISSSVFGAGLQSFTIC